MVKCICLGRRVDRCLRVFGERREKQMSLLSRPRDWCTFSKSLLSWVAPGQVCEYTWLAGWHACCLHSLSYLSNGDAALKSVSHSGRHFSHCWAADLSLASSAAASQEIAVHLSLRPHVMSRACTHICRSLVHLHSAIYIAAYTLLTLLHHRSGLLTQSSRLVTCRSRVHLKNLYDMLEALWYCWESTTSLQQPTLNTVYRRLSVQVTV